MVQQQLMVQRQLLGQICACLKPTWKISQGTRQARSNVRSLNEAGEAVFSSQSWLLRGLCKHQIKQSPVSRETMRLNPRGSLGTIKHKPNHSSKRPLRDGEAQVPGPDPRSISVRGAFHIPLPSWKPLLALPHLICSFPPCQVSQN